MSRIATKWFAFVDKVSSVHGNKI